MSFKLDVKCTSYHASWLILAIDWDKSLRAAFWAVTARTLHLILKHLRMNADLFSSLRDPVLHLCILYL